MDQDNMYPMVPTIRAAMRIPDTLVTTYKDSETMAQVVSAKLDADLSAYLADAVVARLSEMASIPKHEFAGFLHFLGQSKEMQEMYVAYKAAKRLRGE